MEAQNTELGGASSVGLCAWGSKRLGRWRPGELQKLGGLGVSPAREALRSPEGWDSVRDEGPGLGKEERPPRPRGRQCYTDTPGRARGPCTARRMAEMSDSEGHSQPAGGQR